ncbi:hypothetical protein CBR_g74200, partial [Chara braunii]
DTAHVRGPAPSTTSADSTTTSSEQRAAGRGSPGDTARVRTGEPMGNCDGGTTPSVHAAGARVRRGVERKGERTAAWIDRLAALIVALEIGRRGGLYCIATTAITRWLSHRERRRVQAEIRRIEHRIWSDESWLLAFDPQRRAPTHARCQSGGNRSGKGRPIDRVATAVRRSPSTNRIAHQESRAALRRHRARWAAVRPRRRSVRPPLRQPSDLPQARGRQPRPQQDETHRAGRQPPSQLAAATQDWQIMKAVRRAALTRSFVTDPAADTKTADGELILQVEEKMAIAQITYMRAHIIVMRFEGPLKDLALQAKLDWIRCWELENWPEKGQASYQGRAMVEGGALVFYWAPTAALRDWVLDERGSEGIRLGDCTHLVRFTSWKSPVEVKWERLQERKAQPWVRFVQPPSMAVLMLRQLAESFFGAVRNPEGTWAIDGDGRETIRFDLYPPLRSQGLERLAVAQAYYGRPEVRGVTSETPWCDNCRRHGHLTRRGRCVNMAETKEELARREHLLRTDPGLPRDDFTEIACWVDFEKEFDTVIFTEIATESSLGGGMEVGDRQLLQPAPPHQAAAADGADGAHSRQPAIPDQGSNKVPEKQGLAGPREHHRGGQGQQKEQEAPWSTAGRPSEAREAAVSRGSCTAGQAHAARASAASASATAGTTEATIPPRTPRAPSTTADVAASISVKAEAPTAPAATIPASAIAISTRTEYSREVIVLSGDTQPDQTVAREVGGQREGGEQPAPMECCENKEEQQPAMVARSSDQKSGDGRATNPQPYEQPGHHEESRSRGQETNPEALAGGGAVNSGQAGGQVKGPPPNQHQQPGQRREGKDVMRPQGLGVERIGTEPPPFVHSQQRCGSAVAEASARGRRTPAQVPKPKGRSKFKRGLVGTAETGPLIRPHGQRLKRRVATRVLCYGTTSRGRFSSQKDRRGRRQQKTPPRSAAGPQAIPGADSGLLDGVKDLKLGPPQQQEEGPPQNGQGLNFKRGRQRKQGRGRTSREASPVDLPEESEQDKRRRTLESPIGKATQHPEGKDWQHFVEITSSSSQALEPALSLPPSRGPSALQPLPSPPSSQPRSANAGNPQGHQPSHLSPSSSPDDDGIEEQNLGQSLRGAPGAPEDVGHVNDHVQLARILLLDGRFDELRSQGRICIVPIICRLFDGKIQAMLYHRPETSQDPAIPFVKVSEHPSMQRAVAVAERGAGPAYKISPVKGISAIRLLLKGSATQTIGAYCFMLRAEPATRAPFPPQDPTFTWCDLFPLISEVGDVLEQSVHPGQSASFLALLNKHLPKNKRFTHPSFTADPQLWLRGPRPLGRKARSGDAPGP